MTNAERAAVKRASEAALAVLHHNARNPATGLPRTAGTGYPEPYTRDLMIASLGMLTSGSGALLKSLRRVLQSLARNQSPLGHIPGLADDPEDRGSSDTTPLFLIGLALFRAATGESRFLDAPARKALTWLQYQSPDDRVLVAQQPTSDWRDEQWVVGYGLYVNVLVYLCLRFFGQAGRAAALKRLMNRHTVTSGVLRRPDHEGLLLRGKPHYAFWSYKVLSSEHFDLVGNSLAIIAGIPSRTRARSIVSWVEAECGRMRKAGRLSGDLPPNFFPFITPGHAEWKERYALYNQPGEYHNGGVWPFACSLYIAAAVAAGRMRLAERKLAALTGLVRASRTPGFDCGFNEWFRAQDGKACGQDWQTWSAAMYLYAVRCVETKRTPFFDELRTGWA